MNSGLLPVIIISGPTASGKTLFSIELALMIQNDLCQKAEIINFDSLLFYKYLNIGTAKPSLEERRGVVHHMIDISEINSPLNASDYIQMAKEKIDHLHSQKTIPILVGGSAFYLRALIKGMYGDEENLSLDPDLAEKKTQIALEALEIIKTLGIGPIREYLLIHDPQSYSQLHENDHYRNARAYEFHRLYGTKISEQKKKADLAKPYDFSNHPHPNWKLHHYYLNIPKEQHWPLIEKRTQTMFEVGIIDEVQDILKLGHCAQDKPLRSIGYKEVIEHLQGHSTLEQCREKIIIATRQLAKAQRTFFNKITPKETFNPITQKDLFLQKAKEDLLKGPA